MEIKTDSEAKSDIYTRTSQARKRVPSLLNNII